MTVRELRAALAPYSDDTLIYIYNDGEPQEATVQGWRLPDGTLDTEHFTLTFEK